MYAILVIESVCTNVPIIIKLEITVFGTNAATAKLSIKIHMIIFF